MQQEMKWSVHKLLLITIVGLLASTSKVEARLESKDIGSDNKEIIPSATDPGDESSSGHDTEDEIRRYISGCYHLSR